MTDFQLDLTYDPISKQSFLSGGGFSFVHLDSVSLLKGEILELSQNCYLELLISDTLTNI